ncbi:hypothetical protein B0I35DRAFT_435913 [Stachybotrys elegans]|uniref:Uncharacterized protein n=1 Tax=Stachybotrys elegans TaxID=80388 RepID=A0A8K0WQK1_9HYPO|nr:hypothetical protein B0I35DRAFT_435913 [Stachybotrys elegans]
MENTAEPIPILLFGKSLEVGSTVTATMKPEVEVIHFMNSTEYVEVNLRSLLEGKGPKEPSTTSLGTHNYAKPPRAVVFGRGATPEFVQEMYGMLHGVGVGNVAWLAGDPSVVPSKDGPPPGYAEKAANTVKKLLLNWVDAGAKDEGIIYY